MNGIEYLDKCVSKEKILEAIYKYNCPFDFGFDTEVSSNKKSCCGDYQGDCCKKCWESKVINGN